MPPKNVKNLAEEFFFIGSCSRQAWTQKYFLDPVRDDRNFPTATGEHFAVAAVAAAVDIT